MPPDNERPGVTDPGSELDADGDRLKASIPATADEIRRRRDWARRMIKAASAPLPRYGDAEWHCLAETDRRRVAAVVVAAEAWQQGCDDVPGRLRQEIADGRAAHVALEAEDFASLAAGIRHLASVPSFAELSDRRGQPDRAARARQRSAEIRDGWNRAGGGDAA